MVSTLLMFHLCLLMFTLYILRCAHKLIVGECARNWSESGCGVLYYRRAELYQEVARSRHSVPLICSAFRNALGHLMIRRLYLFEGLVSNEALLVDHCIFCNGFIFGSNLMLSFIMINDYYRSSCGYAHNSLQIEFIIVFFVLPFLCYNSCVRK